MKQPKLYPTARGTFIVAWPEPHEGKLRRKTREYSDEGRANDHFAELQRKFPIVGASGLFMDAEARADYAVLRKILPEGVTGADAARFWVAQHPQGEDMEASALLKEWLAVAGRNDKSERTPKDRSKILARFLVRQGIVYLSGITTEAIEAYLWRGVGPQTIIQEASQLRGWCKWLVRRKRLLAVNPMDQIELPSREDPEPRTLTAAQAGALLRAAAEMDDDPRRQYGCDLAPVLAIALLAGLRPSEILRLTPDSARIDAEEPFFRVRKLKRGRGVRLTPICPALAAWLKARPLAYPVRMSEKAFNRARRMAGALDIWQGDIMRHTYISARLACGANEDAVAAESGNTAKIIQRHYRDLLTRSEGEALLALMPPPAPQPRAALR